MIIWINGPFGVGKTTLANALKGKIENSAIFDPEEVGLIIHKSIPDIKDIDFQTFSMWRRLVIQFITDLKNEFEKNIIIPMALVVPKYQNEIFEGLGKFEKELHHFYLDIDECILKKRILEQREYSDQINQWRLNQVGRCLEAKKTMPENTVFLNSGKMSSEELATEVLHKII